MSLKCLSRVWDYSEQKGSNLLLMLALADIANDDGYCWPSIDWLAERTRLSSRQVIRLLEQLEEAGELQALRRRKGNRYLVTVWGPDGPNVPYCKLCGQIGHPALGILIHRHHIKPKSEGGTDDPENLIELCESCHREVHAELSRGNEILSCDIGVTLEVTPMSLRSDIAMSDNPLNTPSIDPSSAPAADEPRSSSQFVTDPVTNDVYYKDASQSGFGRSKTWVYDCPECGTQIMFDKLGPVQECRGCGREYRLVKARPKVADDPAMSYLFTRANAGSVHRKFHGFSIEEKEKWRHAVDTAGVAAAKEWVDLAFDMGKRGADLAYWVYACLVKYQRAPLKKEERQEEELTEAMLGLNV